MTMSSSPREFAAAMRELVVRSQQNPATAVSEQAYDVKLRTLDYFIRRNPTRDEFEKLLQERISDTDPGKEMSRFVCCQIFNSWRSGSYRHAVDGTLLLLALYPADPSSAPEDRGSGEAE